MIIPSARILLAEDDAGMRALLAVSLRRAGFTVMEARDGSELMQMLERKDGPDALPDLVVSDVRMPAGSGFYVLGALRQAGLEVPVILITAFGDAHTHERARLLGATAVLDKPFELATLTTLIRRTLADPAIAAAR